ncbi:hypothetical protein A3A71_02765 [Candidatus Berkelbacteria bacterium RIFCSPLOWO2_01_FULL_50_28]|uniref:RNA polymerase alpha subunit C-terminal domain-containing protein n=1 Tax=Candidatus Berkelbacteria bacterium RIFCSPLOWO2_01_FULL_50_28 TaxID=1797471 RepID=A0A1F5ECK8_9BACT|nr:MAG: hypothetical protein A2807_02300 [Candidatus Berkelbacteria bacterium RIFCSPHIGHO2_01_FULL_50_36]OGD64944.1 MAG: hypothetical protein A3A71_02765 [Candidatus Berkelbacteria bacterium RIFCSPLOWO2_01_FULL_50_28]
MKLILEGREDLVYPGQLGAILGVNIEYLEKELEMLRRLLASRKRARNAMLGSGRVIPDLPIQMLGFSKKAMTALLSAEVETLRGIAGLSESQLKMIKAFSSVSYWEIRNRLREFGIELDERS